MAIFEIHQASFRLNGFPTACTSGSLQEIARWFGSACGIPDGSFESYCAACPPVDYACISSSICCAYAMQTVKPTGLGWRQTARAIHRTKGKRLARPDRMDVVTRTIVVTKGIVHVEATRRKSHHSNSKSMTAGFPCGISVSVEGLIPTIVS